FCHVLLGPSPTRALFPYTTLFRSVPRQAQAFAEELQLAVRGLERATDVPLGAGAAGEAETDGRQLWRIEAQGEAVGGRTERTVRIEGVAGDAQRHAHLGQALALEAQAPLAAQRQAFEAAVGDEEVERGGLGQARGRQLRLGLEIEVQACGGCGRRQRTRVDAAQAGVEREVA